MSKVLDMTDISLGFRRLSVLIFLVGLTAVLCLVWGNADNYPGILVAEPLAATTLPSDDPLAGSVPEGYRLDAAPQPLASAPSQTTDSNRLRPGEREVPIPKGAVIDPKSLTDSDFVPDDAAHQATPAAFSVVLRLIKDIAMVSLLLAVLPAHSCCCLVGSSRGSGNSQHG